MLSASPASGAAQHATTIVDAFLYDPTAYHWQWVVDLSNFDEIRFHSSSGTALWVHYSPSVASEPGTLDPADWLQFATTFAPGEPGAGGPFFLNSQVLTSGNGVPLNWAVIPEDLRKPLRLTLSVNRGTNDPAPGPAIQMNRFFFVESFFAVNIQARLA